MLNVVYLHSHDAGRYIEPYGYPMETPHLMAFARESVLFRKAFSAAPTCGPSRAALASGQYPHQVGVYGLPGQQGWVLDDYSKHWVQNFNRWGYQTVLAGCQHEAALADFSAIGYQRVLDAEAPARDVPGECYQETVDKVERFLATYRGERPFFLSFGTDEPHRDNFKRAELGIEGASRSFSKTRYYDPDKLDYRYTAPLPWLPDVPEFRKDVESYKHGVRVMDEYMGRVLFALKQNGFYDNTLIIVTSDHGVEFTGGKKTLRDQGVQVMLMLKGPEGTGFAGGKVIEPIVSHLDLFPTVCKLLNQKPSHPLEGKDLEPLVNGVTKSLHEYVFAEQTYHGDKEPLRSVRSERYKLIKRHLPMGPILRQDGPTDKLMDKWGYYDQSLGCEELFDLYLDPMESNNLASDDRYLDLKNRLSDVLDCKMRKTDDPFLSGSFPLPPTSR